MEVVTSLEVSGGAAMSCCADRQGSETERSVSPYSVYLFMRKYEINSARVLDWYQSILINVARINGQIPDLLLQGLLADYHKNGLYRLRSRFSRNEPADDGFIIDAIWKKRSQ